ncbi:hypothetical protein HGRIS_000700 [Hohenbuehelia grisea]|uniref:Uncharacterized protein n=1 Tax=Hohenbuehelia grisea TaxID=104357 RepID=A0ABR3JT54_9AGAR
MFKVKTSSTLRPLWGPIGLPGGICRSFRFLKDDQAILFIAEAGEMRIVNATTGGLVWKGNLASAIGNVVFSADMSKILVNNLNSGAFDVYDYPQENPLRTLIIPSTRPRLKQGLFAEDGDSVAICGSDHSTVYVFNANTGARHQALLQDSSKVLVQSLAYFKGQNDHLLASGSARAICIWQKSQGRDPFPDPEENIPPLSPARRGYHLSVQELLLFLILIFVSHQQLYRFYIETKASAFTVYNSLLNKEDLALKAPSSPPHRGTPHDDAEPVTVTLSEVTRQRQEPLRRGPKSTVRGPSYEDF